MGYSSTIKSSTNSDEGKVDDRPALWDALISDQSDHEDSLIQLAAQKNSPPGHDIRKRKSFMALTNDQDVQTESLEFNNGKMDEINFFEGETEMLKFFESIASLAGRFPSRIRSFLRFKISQLIYETECQINSSDVAIVSNSTKS